jgi:hypothetical protein
MAITTYDGLISALGNSTDYVIAKTSIATQGAGGFTSLWRGGGIPAQGGVPTATGTTCLSTLTGSLGTVTVATGQTCYLSNLAVNGSLAHHFYVYDRILHNGGLVANSTASTALAGVDISGISDRYIATDASNIHWWAEIYTDIGTTGGLITFTYTSPTATSQSATVTIGGSSPLNQDSRAFRIIPAAGHPIVSIQSFRFTTSTGTAGSWGIVASRQLTTVNMGQIYIGVDRDFAGVGLPKVGQNACIYFVILSSTTSSGAIDGRVQLIQG